MAKDLTSKQDVDKSLDSQESGGGLTLKIPEGETPVYFLSSAYEDGYIHWLDTPGVGRMRVVCGGGLEGKGYAPDTCPICAYCKGLYERARGLVSEGKTDAGDKLKNLANSIHAKYEAQFIVAKGEVVVMKDAATGAKKKVADFDEAEVGILPMTSKQYQDFMAMRDDDRYPFIRGTEDLLNRAIILDKAKRDAKGKPARYATIEFRPARNQSDAPKVEWKSEDFPLADNFKIDVEQIKKAASALVGGGAAKPKPSSTVADDAYEVDEAVDDFVGDDSALDDSDLGATAVADDDFLDDVEGDAAPAKTKPAPAKQAPAKAAPAKAQSKRAVPEDAEF